LLVAPTSQQWRGPPDLDKFDAMAVPVEGGAGDAILITYTQLTVRPMSPLRPFEQSLIDGASTGLPGWFFASTRN